MKQNSISNGNFILRRAKLKMLNKSYSVIKLYSLFSFTIHNPISDISDFSEFLDFFDT